MDYHVMEARHVAGHTVWLRFRDGTIGEVDLTAALRGPVFERLKDVENYATSPAYTDDERAAIAYADAMTTDPHTITDEQVADLQRRFGDDGVIELTYQIGIENMRARMYSALGITEQGFNSGDACRVPWATEDEQAASQ